MRGGVGGWPCGRSGAGLGSIGHIGGRAVRWCAPDSRMAKGGDEEMREGEYWDWALMVVGGGGS